MCYVCYPVEVRDAGHPHISWHIPWFNLVYIERVKIVQKNLISSFM